MTKSKKSIAMHGTLLCPLVLGHCAFLRANGYIWPAAGRCQRHHLPHLDRRGDPRAVGGYDPF